MWEQLFSMLKRASSLTFSTDRLYGDVFAPSETEAAPVLISRPITHVSKDIDEDLSLTSKPLLIGQQFVLTPASAFDRVSTHKLSKKVHAKMAPGGTNEITLTLIT